MYLWILLGYLFFILAEINTNKNPEPHPGLLTCAASLVKLLLAMSVMQLPQKRYRKSLLNWDPPQIPRHGGLNFRCSIENLCKLHPKREQQKAPPSITVTTYISPWIWWFTSRIIQSYPNLPSQAGGRLPLFVSNHVAARHDLRFWHARGPSPHEVATRNAAFRWRLDGSHTLNGDVRASFCLKNHGGIYVLIYIYVCDYYIQLYFLSVYLSIDLSIYINLFIQFVVVYIIIFTSVLKITCAPMKSHDHKQLPFVNHKPPAKEILYSLILCSVCSVSRLFSSYPSYPQFWCTWHNRV